MLYRNTTREQLEEAARLADVRLSFGTPPSGRALRATLALLPDPDEPSRAPLWQRRSASRSRRKVAAVCWHGHAVFMLHLYLLNPNVRITGGRENYVDYRDAVHFLGTFRTTGEWNIGSPAYPVAYADACECPRSLVREVTTLQRRLEIKTGVLPGGA